ncbi:MAG: type II toxin-antitoxin system HicA family toxin [Chloroflexota bacterium]
MIKRRELERYLRDNGCAPLREGAKHSIWHNPQTGRRTSIPRHRDLPLTTARAICAQLGIPPIGTN